MKLPAEYFNKPIIGKIITKPIAFGKQVFPPEEYDVINFKDGIYTCNQWYKEYKKVPQFIQKDMVKKFIKKNQLNDIKENKNMKIKKSILRKIIKEEIQLLKEDNELLEPINKQKIKRILYKKLNPTIKGFFRDNDWKNIYDVFDSIRNLGLTCDITKAYYGSGEYDNTMPPQRKSWFFKISFVNDRGNKDKLYGKLIAAGAGSVKDPLEKYDITLILT